MMRTMRRLLVGLLSLTAFLTVGSPAFAMYPPPDPGSHDWVTITSPALATTTSTTTSGTSLAREVAWMLSGAGITLALVAVAVLITVASRRHQVGARQLQTS